VVEVGVVEVVGYAEQRCAALTAEGEVGWIVETATSAWHGDTSRRRRSDLKARSVETCQVWSESASAAIITRGAKRVQPKIFWKSLQENRATGIFMLILWRMPAHRDPNDDNGALRRRRF
jgi:hypothetical protein